MGRKFLAAREDLVEKIKNLAKKKNLTLYALINETLEQVLKAEEAEKTLAEIVDEYKTLKMVKEAGFILTPSNLIYPILEKTFKDEEKNLTKIWFENGEWFGKYCKTMFPNQNHQKILEKILNTIFWDLSDCTINQNNDEISIKCVSSRYTSSYTHLLVSFILGMMKPYNYQPIKKDVSRGIVALTFKEEKGE